MILCKNCHNPLSISDASYLCKSCNTEYLNKDGIIIFSDETVSENNYYPEGYFEKLFDTEINSFWFIVRNKIICQTIMDFLPKSAKIIEIGCGTGHVASEIKKNGFTIDGADLFLEALVFCQKRNAGRHFFQLNIEEKIFVEEYDAVCAFDVIEHIDDDYLALTNMKNMLKEGGLIFITVPACHSLWSTGDVFMEHKRRYEYTELVERVQKAGFDVCRITYFNSILFPLVYLVRKITNNSTISDSSPEAVSNRYFFLLKPNRIINSVLYAIFSVEPFFLRYMNFPIGGSLICVAKKRSE